MDPKELLETARRASRAAADVHRAYLGRVAIEEWTEKGTADFVTHVDREAERVIVELVRRRHAGHLVLAEEAATERPGASGAGLEEQAGSDWTWIIDPLDGTTNYLHRYPMYAVSIAVVQRGELVMGLVRNTVTDEEWCAVRGGGAFRNGQRIAVSEIERLTHALIGTGFPFRALDLLPEYTRQLEAAVRVTSGVRRAGSAALDLCHVASGYFDAFWELSLAPWDVAAGTLIVREAGGVVTRLDGSADVLGHGSILAGNRALHAALGELMRDATAGARVA